MGQEELEGRKCKERMDHYENKRKTLENSKDSLDLIYERKRGMGKSCSADFSYPKKEENPTGQKSSWRVKENRIFACPSAEDFHRANGFPRSVSDLPERLVRKWSDGGGGDGHGSRRERWSTLGQRRSESAELNGVIVEVQPHQLLRTHSRESHGRSARSRSATIPRKSSQYSLSPSTASGESIFILLLPNMMHACQILS